MDYSPDVEFDENGKLVFTRDLREGEAICMPMHMIANRKAFGDLLRLANEKRR